MKTDLFYYTGTGNSLWAARTLSSLLGNTRIIPISRVGDAPGAGQPDAVGIVFPVHVWGLPRRVIDFVHTLAFHDKTPYCFAIAVNAGQVAATLLQLDKLMATRGITLSAGFELVMPSNYIPWGGPGPVEKQRKRFRDAGEKIEQIAGIVMAGEVKPVEKGPFWQNILFSRLYKLTFPRIPGMDKSFWVDERCNACGICKNVCPCGNIEIDKEKKPLWRHHCEQCLACIQWCPQEAIQFGKRTLRLERYHHPEIALKELLNRNK